MSKSRLTMTLAMLLLTVAAPLRAVQTCPAGNDLVTPDADLVVTAPPDGTLTHVKTGLMWKQCSEGQSGDGCNIGTAGTVTWVQALNAAASANLGNFAGHSDWRLPSKIELESIVETGCYGPAINGTRFPNTPSFYFWTSTSSSESPANAWLVGDAGYASADSKANGAHVRLVRGGLSLGFFDRTGTGCTFDVDGNGTQDALTDGLLILRAMFGLTGTAATNGVIGGGAPARTTWAQIRPYLNGSCGGSFSP